MSLEEAESGFEQAFRNAVATHLVADVDVVLTLSGGIDSTILGLLASEVQERPVKTFSIADHRGHTDLAQARQMATLMRSEHHEYVICFEDYLAAIPAAVAAEERPSSLFGLPLYLLCREIAKHAKCALHGEGADELLGGYSEYVDREHGLRHLREHVPLLEKLGVPPSHEAAQVIEQLTSASGFEEYLRRMFDINLGKPLQWHHLDLVDRYSMAFGVEMRVPYLDDRLVEFVGGLPIRQLVHKELGIRKYLLRRFAVRHYGIDVLDVVLREKLGAPSAGFRLLKRFDQLCDDRLPDSYVANHPFGRFLDSKRQLLLFDLFLEVFMRHRGDHKAVGSIEEFIAVRSASRRAEDEVWST